MVNKCGAFCSVNKCQIWKNFADTIIFLDFLHKKWIIRYIRSIEVNIRVPVCLPGCNFIFTGTLIFISAVTGNGALATALVLRTRTSQRSLLKIFCYNNKVPWKVKDYQKISKRNLLLSSIKTVLNSTKSKKH